MSFLHFLQYIQSHFCFFALNVLFPSVLSFCIDTFCPLVLKMHIVPKLSSSVLALFLVDEFRKSRSSSALVCFVSLTRSIKTLRLNQIKGRTCPRQINLCGISTNLPGRGRHSAHRCARFCFFVFFCFWPCKKK